MERFPSYLRLFEQGSRGTLGEHQTVDAALHAPAPARWAGHAVRFRLGSSRRLFPIARHLYVGSSRKAVTPSTDIVIEGFPRSANSFARRSFVYAQDSPPDVCGHTHFPVAVLDAIDLGVPVLLLVREPRDAVLSHLVMAPHLTPRLLLNEYVRFYRPLLPSLDRVVVGTFEQVTTDFGRVIERVNERFGTAFTPFRHDDENERAVFRLQEQNYQQNVARGRDVELGVARPSDRRRELKQRAAHRVDAPGVGAALARARSVHRVVAEAATG